MVVFGHIGDNIIHIAVAPRPWSDDAKYKAEEAVCKPLADFQGSISAEHCIGIDKRRWLYLSRSPAELTLMRQLKSALDPHNLLNRGKVLPES